MKKPANNEREETGAVRSSAWLGRIRRIERMANPDMAERMIRAGWHLLSAGRKNGEPTYTLGSMLDPDTARNEADTLLDRTPAANQA